MYSENHEKTPIPKGYRHTEGERYNGFAIERECEGSQFVWVPVGYLDNNGTLDSVSFSEKFGRRNFFRNKSFGNQFIEPLVGTLSLQFESVKKYGGVYISRYCMSKNKKTGKVQSVKGEKPLLYISFNNTMKFAMAFESKNTLMSHLP